MAPLGNYRRSRTGKLPAILLLALAGCAQLAPAPAPLTRYQCDDGKEFSVRIATAGDFARIDISGMHFTLQAEPARGPGVWYGCDELTLWQDGDRARVEMAGAEHFTNCRKTP